VRIAVDAQKAVDIDVGIALSRRQRAVAQQFLNGSQVRARLEEMGGEAVPQRVWVDPGGKSCPFDMTVDDTTHRPCAEATTSVVEEDGLSGRVRYLEPEAVPGLEPSTKGMASRISERHHPFLVAFSHHPKDAALEVDIGPLETDQLTYPQAGGIQHLQNGMISALEGLVAGRGREDGIDLDRTEVAGEALVYLGGPNPGRGVGP
jgi:hypothetical protein